MRQLILDYLQQINNDMKIAMEKLIDQKNNFRDSGKYRKITNIDNGITKLNVQIKSSQFAINTVENLNFENNTDSIRECLSPYGVFCDRTNFYYNENKLKKYSIEYKMQIIMCEVFNSLQDYFIRSELNELRKLKCRGRSLTCLYSIGLINETIPLYNYEEEKIMEAFYKKYPSVKIITYEPNEKAAKYLFQKLVWNEDKKLGDIIEKWEFCDSIVLTVQPKKLYNSERDGIEVRNAPLENRQVYYINENNQYVRVNAQHPIIIKNRDAIKITKKLIE